MAPLLAKTRTTDRHFERIYRRHVADVYRYSLAVLRNPQDAEDVTQTTFLNAYRAMQNGERPARPQNWLITIAHNVCRQRFRQAARRPAEAVLEENAVVVEPHESTYSADDIQRALGQLAFNQRSALVLRELEGRSYAEIAALTGLTVAAVETVLFRARRALREQLEGALTCAGAERFLSRRLDGELPRSERSQLRAHLRECGECATIARSQRASRGALKSLLGSLPIPASLLGGGSSMTVGVAAKAAAVACAGALVGTGGYEAATQARPKPVASRAVAGLVGGAVAQAPKTRAGALGRPRMLTPSARVVEVAATLRVTTSVARPTEPDRHDGGGGDAAGSESRGSGDGQMSENQMSDVQVSDGHGSGQSSDGHGSDGQSSDGLSVNGQASTPRAPVVTPGPMLAAPSGDGHGSGDGTAPLQQGSGGGGDTQVPGTTSIDSSGDGGDGS